MTSTNPDVETFARLIDALTPWLDLVVIVGGWAHRLYRLHPLAQPLDYPPLITLDADAARPTRLKVKGQNIHQRMTATGFQARKEVVARRGSGGLQFWIQGGLSLIRFRADGYFFLPLWINWRIGPEPGILDWCTLIGAWLPWLP